VSEGASNTVAHAGLCLAGKHLALLEQRADIGTWSFDLRSGTHCWSQSMYALAGYSPAEPIDTEILRNSVCVSEQVHVAQAIGYALNTGEQFDCVVHGVTLGPERGWAAGQVLEVHCAVEMDELGAPALIYGTCQNITERVREEDARQLKQRQFAAMLGGASDIIVFYTPDGRVVYASEALGRLLGRTPREIERGRYMRFVHPADLAEAKRVMLRPQPGCENSATYRVQRKDGQYVWIEAVTRAIFDDCTGRISNLVTVLRDVTERKIFENGLLAAQRKAEAASRAKSTFLANMSHELRTPLNAIIGFSEIMKDATFGPMGDARYAEYSDLILKSGRHLLSLITDILDLAKIEAGKMELVPTTCGVADIIGDCAKTLAAQAAQASLSFSIDAPPGLLARCDRRALMQVILNLLSNAIKFSKPGETVRIGAAVHAGRVKIWVQDRGVGMSEEEVARAGTPFEQSRRDAFHAGQGTGLGLALAKALVERHGGQLHIQSQLDVGTTVTVDFPDAQSELPALIA